MKTNKFLDYKTQLIRLFWFNLSFHQFGIQSTIAISISSHHLALLPRSESSTIDHSSIGQDGFQKRSKKVLGVIMMKASDHNLTADGVTVLAPVSNVDKAVLKNLNISTTSNALSHGSQETSQDMSMGFKNDFNSLANITTLPKSNQFGLSEPTNHTTSNHMTLTTEPNTTSAIPILPGNFTKDLTLSKPIDHVRSDPSTPTETQNRNQESNQNETNPIENHEMNHNPNESSLDQEEGNVSGSNETQVQSNAGNQTKSIDDWQYLASNSPLNSDFMPQKLTLLIPFVLLYSFGFSLI